MKECFDGFSGPVSWAFEAGSFILGLALRGIVAAVCQDWLLPRAPENPAGLEQRKKKAQEPFCIADDSRDQEDQRDDNRKQEGRAPER